MKEKLKNRYFLLGIGFAIFMAVIGFRLFSLQIVEGEKYNADSQKRVFKEGTIEAPRGKILDRYGVPVAVNRQGFTLKIVKTDIAAAELNDMLLKLASILDKSGKGYNNSLDKYLTFNPLTFNGRSQTEIKSWETNANRLGMKAADFKNTPEGLFKYLKEELFKIDPKYTDEDAYKIMELRYEILVNNWTFVTGGTVSLATDVGIETVSQIEERHQEFPGIVTDVEPVREYLDAYNEAQVVGYVGAITSKQYDSLKSEGYQNDDILGQVGVEKQAERWLKGTDGKKSIQVDTSGKLTEQQVTIPAIPGSDVMLTLDANIQKAAMDSLKRNIDIIKNKNDKNNKHDANAGSVVVMDVNSGEVLAMASYPSYDPQVFIEAADDKNARQTIVNLNKDENKPQLNRAIQEIYAPGSTFKPLTAISALESGVISIANSRVNDPGHINIGNREFYCLEYPNYGHGWLDLKKALETSDNIYFHYIGWKTGIAAIDKWAGYFGLGRKTGIDLPGEVAGNMSSIESKQAKHEGSDGIWRPADTAQVAIGQFENAFTPLQIVDYISALANGGKLYKPYIIKQIVKYDGSIVNETKPSFEQIPVKPEFINAIKEGMVRVTEATDGTAQEAFKGLPFEVAGKTGTAQTGKEATHSSNALFVCYAPANKPQIAIAVVVERGAWGSNTAPIARDIIDEYFGLKKANTDTGIVVSEQPMLIQ